jgi:hypothetical protein
MYQSMQEGNPGYASLGRISAHRVLEAAAIIDPTTAVWNELAEAAKG